MQPALPALLELKNVVYRGLEGITTPVNLVDGHWQGEPFAPGGASRPVVQFVRDFQLVGDLDDDGKAESVVLLGESSGGTGEWIHLAVVARRSIELVNVATIRVGDRIQVRAARVEAGQIVLDILQAGPNDAMCCPGELATRAWELHGTTLRELPAATPPRRLGLETLLDTEWVLSWWSWTESAPQAPEVTLRFADRQFAGASGCNRYFAAASAGPMIGDVEVGNPSATMMACAEPAASVETRFLRQLQGVKKFGFVATQLALTYEKDGRLETMLFSGRAPSE
ncbi:MAG TPA: META domain-containing protein [Candidatus Krumholzibacteria bacterium]|nr:META domain-containing protein [Candidatus Krumholzibacteria bacterium]